MSPADITVVAGMNSAQIAHAAASVVVGPATLRISYTVVAHGPQPVIARSRAQGGCAHDVELLATARTCVACAVRDDVFAVIAARGDGQLWSDLVIALPAGAEPACVTEPIDLMTAALADEPDTGGPEVAIGCVLTAVAAESFCLAVLGAHSTGDRGRRPLADLVISQVASSDVIFLTESTAVAHDGSQARALLHHLAPRAAVVRADLREVLGCQVAAARHDPHRTELGLENVGAINAGDVDLVGDRHGISSRVWRSRRALHPERFHDAFETLANHAVHVTGHVHVANRPHEVLRLEVRGGAVAFRRVDAWLCGAPEHVWDEVSPHRRERALREWDPYYGDRSHELLLVTAAHDPGDDPGSRLCATLDSALLADEELAGGMDAWVHADDPLVQYLGEPWVCHPSLV